MMLEGASSVAKTATVVSVANLHEPKLYGSQFFLCAGFGDREDWRNIPITLIDPWPRF
jgi:hypothetical protein